MWSTFYYQHCGGLPALWATVQRSFFLFFCFFVRCDELSDFPPSRLKVQHIPGCSGQNDFNLFSQAGRHRQTDTIWLGISVPVPSPTSSECQSLTWGKYQRGKSWGGSRPASHVGLTLKEKRKTSEPHAAWKYLYTVISSRGITLELTHSFVTAEKTKKTRVEAIRNSRGQTLHWFSKRTNQRSGGVCLSQTSQGRVKVQDEVWKTHQNHFEKYEEEASCDTAEVGRS